MELWLELTLIALIYVLSGLVKGVIGFALPLVSISLLSIIVTVEQALALNTFPLLVTNAWLAIQGGEVLILLRRYWLMIVMLATGIFISANIVVNIDKRSLLLVLGIIVIALSLLEQFRPQVKLPDHHADWVGGLAGLCGGLVGGLASAMAAPMAIYLAARKVPKDEFVATMGVVLTCGSLTLLVAFSSVKILTLENAPLSLASVLPAVAGLMLGGRLRGAVNQGVFQKLVLLGLILIGMNFLRRALF